MLPHVAAKYFLYSFTMPGQNTGSMENINISPLEQYVIDKVRDLRIEKGMSQRDLADALEISNGFIGKVESTSKRAKYNLSLINQLAKVFNCSPREFLPDKPL